MFVFHYILCTLLVVLCIIFVRILVQYLKNRSSLCKIPCLPQHWLLGNLFEIVGKDPGNIFQLLRNTAKNLYPIYRFEFFLTTVNFLHPSDIEIVLSPMKHLSKSAIYDLLSNWLGEGLLTSTGQKWQNRRKILTPAFHFKILQQFLNIFYDETEKLVKQIEANCNDPSIDVIPLVTQMTLQSISEAAMGLDNIDKATQDKYKNSVYKLGKLLLLKLTKPWYRIPLIYYFAPMKKEEDSVVQYLHQISYDVIKYREQKMLESHNSEQHTVSYSGRKIIRMLDLLLSEKMNGNNIDLDGIREEVDTFMFEGHDTTSMAITFLLLSLASHRDVQEKVVQEIDDVVQSTIPTYNELQDLRYTEMVIKETLRLYPSVPFISRVASEAFTTYTGYHIPKGTILHVHIFDLHRDPRIYPDPLKFDPDRFLPENCRNRHSFAYIPFSAGPRNCIGQRFALLELKSVICGILRKFSLHQIDNPADIAFYPDLVLRPTTGIRIKFVPR